MKTKYFISFIILISSFIITGSVIAADIQYPVKELGNCKDEAACKTYCDKPANMEACINFAEKNNLMSSEEIETAKKFIAAGNKGPGGCENKDACEEYCNDMNHIDKCIAFAEENNLIPPEELAEAKKVQAAISRGVKPPPCGNKKTCDVYCEDPEHMEECINFGIEAGFIQGKELEDTQKMLAAVKRGVKPPPCKGKEACDEYCQEPDHMEECMNFAMEAGFMTEQEKADSQKMLAALKKGVKPPACKGKDECDIYCSQDEHIEECMNFAEAAGFMSPEEAAMARKTGGKGPGGCKGKEECEAFCNNPDNQETCFNFGKENGMIPEADLKQMEEGKKQFQETLNNMPREVSQCLDSSVGTEMMEKFKSGAVMPPKEIGDKMRQCFEKGMGQPGGPQQGPSEPGTGGMMPPAGQTGPGGCKNAEECQKFQPGPGVINPGEQMMPQQAGPGGCKTPDECKSFCETNPDQCKNFGTPPAGEMMPPQGMMQPPEGMMQSPEGIMTPPPEQISPNLLQIFLNFLKGKR